MGSDQGILPGREGHVAGTARRITAFKPFVPVQNRYCVARSAVALRLSEERHQRFGRWAKSGVFERIFQLLASDADNESMMIDATIVRAHQRSAGAQKRRRPSYRSIAWPVNNENSRPR
jgi:transposase